MSLRPPSATRTYTRFPYTSLCRSRDSSGGGVDTTAAFRDWHALNAMNPAFEFELGENARAGHAGDDFLETTHVRRAGGDRLYFPALLLGIAAVHAEEIARKKGSLVATCPGADFQHGGPSVRGIARPQLQCQRAFGLWQLLFQRPNFRREGPRRGKGGVITCK